MIRLAMLGTGSIAQPHAESVLVSTLFYGREGCEIMRIVDAAYESSHRGQVVFLGDEL